MNQAVESLLKYNKPVLSVRNTDRKPLKAQKGCHLMKTRHLVTGAPTAPSRHPKPQLPATKTARHRTAELLDAILPPKKVTTVRYDRESVIDLEMRLDTQLQKRQAKATGVCPVRCELYDQCFEELINHVTVGCAERGHLLSRVRNENHVTIAALKALCESGLEFGKNKALQAEASKAETQHKLSELQAEIADLKEQLSEDELESEYIDLNEAINHEAELNGYRYEIEKLKRANKQLEIQLALIFAPYPPVGVQQ